MHGSLPASQAKCGEARLGVRKFLATWSYMGFIEVASFCPYKTFRHDLFAHFIKLNRCKEVKIMVSF